MPPILAPLLAQAAPVAADALASAATAAPDLLTVGGGALGGLGGVGGLALLWRWLHAYEARVAAMEAAVADLRLALAVAAERDRGVRELLGGLRDALERGR